ncbi:MAG: phosphate ABC transporter substrate-binding protein PstS [bacterium]
MNNIMILTTGIIIIFIFNISAFSQKVELLGAGATFPMPLYTKMFDIYNQKTRIKVNYQAIGSGAGITQLVNKTVDFGATDAFMTDEELSKSGSPILHIPICLGADVITYNLPNNPKLRLSPEVIADIFLGKITNWNDRKLKMLNPEVALPADLKITVVHRSDGSGTTFIFSDYLSKVSNEWKNGPGVGKSLNWPVGLGAKGNSGVAGYIKQLPGAIGYVELAYALQNKMPVAVVKNKSGNFIEPSIKTTSSAASIQLPDDTRASITDTSAKEGYPISGFTWIIIYKEQNYSGRSKEKAQALLDLLWWMTHEGQSLTEPLHYAPLSKDAVKKAETILKSSVYGGVKILK